MKFLGLADRNRISMEVIGMEAEEIFQKFGGRYVADKRSENGYQ